MITPADRRDESTIFEKDVLLEEYVYGSTIERFLSKVKIMESGCWEWMASTSYGYGRIRDGKMVQAHRFMYEYYHGSICPDLDIDHLCRNIICVNPLHLEQVTHKENVLRGLAPTAINARKTHCKRGHEFIKENTYSHGVSRECRICKIAAGVRRRLKDKICN